MNFYSWMSQNLLRKVMELYFNRCCSGLRYENHEDKKYEFQRLNSYRNWPKESSVFPLKLAKAGFYYDGHSDEVICFHCGVRRSSWKSEDEPATIHRDLNPDCEFICDGITDNVAFNAIETDEEENDRLRRIDRLLEIQSQTFFPYDCVILGEQSESSSSASIGDPSTGQDQGAEGSPSGQDTPSAGSMRSDQARSASNTGTNPGANVADAEVPPQGGSRPSTSGQKGNKTKSSRDAHKKQQNNLPEDIPPPTGSELGPLRFERNRLETYKDWPSSDSVPPAELAKWGFYYTGGGDRVKCVFCKGILRNWEAGDRPHIEHRKHFPRCPLILGLRVGNVPLPLDLNASSPTSDPQQNRNVSDCQQNMENLGIITERPKHPQFAVESQRLASFQSWPAYKYQTPQKLASAGFWYAGFNDNVKCFYCNGGLRNWEPGDEPWVEHARWFPQCPFVKQVKGQEFINKVQREKGSGSDTAAEQASQSGEGAATNQPTGGRPLVEDREIRARMDRPHVKMVIDMGYSRELIMKTLKKRFAETGDDFPSATSLLEGIFAMEEEEALTQSTGAGDFDNETENESGEEPAPPEAGSKPDQDNKGPNEQKTTEKENEEKSKTKDLDAENSLENLQTPDQSDRRDELEKENMELKEQRLCKICMTDEATVVFLPCGHLVSCASCSPALQLCPICRAEIKGVVRTYMA